MRNKKILLTIIGVLLFLCAIVGITYAFFTANADTSNNVLYNLTFNGTYNFTVALNNTTDPGIAMSIPTEDMYYNGSDTLVASYSNQFDIKLVNSSNKKVTCAYDYVWYWSSGTSSYTKSPYAEKEFTISSTDIGEVQIPNYGNTTYGTTMGRGTITANANSTVNKYEPFSANFYNLAGSNQSSVKGKTLKGYLTITNASCGDNFAEYLANTAPKSGTSAVGSTPWKLLSDRTNEWRYVGKNPDNYIRFNDYPNDELWRIIGVMPNTTYCTGGYGTDSECSSTATGTLVKIIRNVLLSFTMDLKMTGVGSSISELGSNDWSDSQLMLTLNGYNYVKTGYDINGTQLHVGYRNKEYRIYDNNGYQFHSVESYYLNRSDLAYMHFPAEATTSNYAADSGVFYGNKITDKYLPKIATVRWDLYGTNSYTTAAAGSPTAFYNKERNINNTGLVYTSSSLSENRSVYWYGKIGLMYPSDYGYATNGNNAASGTYSRTGCLGYQMSGWGSGSYKTYCAGNDWLWYEGITSTAPSTSGTAQWTISQLSTSSDHMFIVDSDGSLDSIDAGNTTNQNVFTRPVLYLKADTIFTGTGTGAWNNPYVIQ